MSMAKAVIQLRELVCLAIPNDKIDGIYSAAKRTFIATIIFVFTGIATVFIGSNHFASAFALTAFPLWIVYCIYQLTLITPEWVRFGVNNVLFPSLVAWLGLILKTYRANMAPEFFMLTGVPPDSLDTLYTAYVAIQMVDDFTNHLPSFQQILVLIDRIQYPCGFIFLLAKYALQISLDESQYKKIKVSAFYIFVITTFILGIPFALCHIFDKPLQADKKDRIFYLVELDMGKNGGVCKNVPNKDYIKVTQSKDVLVADMSNLKFVAIQCKFANNAN